MNNPNSSQPKGIYKGLFYETKDIDSATMETRDGSVYIIKNGTLHKRQASTSKRLSPSKRARKEHRALLYLDQISTKETNDPTIL